MSHAECFQVAVVPNAAEQQLVPVIPVDFSTSHAQFENVLDCISARIDACVSEGQYAVVPSSSVGYVYAAWNPLFPDLIKIGATMRAFPFLRIQELSASAGVPEPFQLVACIPTPDPFALERTLHTFYASARKYGRKKEFFLLSREEVSYQFHVRSLGVLDKTKTQSEDKKRKHAKHFQNDEDRTTFKRKLTSFLQMHFQPSEGMFIPTQEIKMMFAEHTSKMPPDQIFFKTLRNQIHTIFPAAIICEKSISGKRSHGYLGLQQNQ